MAIKTLKILIIEDNEPDFRLISEYLKESNLITFEISRAKDKASALEAIKNNFFSAALCDLNLPDSRGLLTIGNIVAAAPSLPVIVLTGVDDENLGIEAINKNAQDYIAKGRLQSELLVKSILYAIERKRAEEGLKRDKELLERLVNEKTEELMSTHTKLAQARRLSDIGTLAATVAHELRNPLAAIHMAVCNLKIKSKDESLSKHLNTIIKKILESDRIINNLLFYARLKPPHKETVNIYELLDECIGLAQNYHQQKNVIINKKISGLKKNQIKADPFQIKEVFSNLINNAYDSISKPKGEIEISADLDGDFIKIRIKDTGSGIETENLNKIFDPFFTTKARGTGLGLTVCKEILNLHNGRIDITSQKNKGTTVTVRLPG